MRVLLLSQILPYPLDSGVKIRTYYMLRRLSQHHEVTLACFVRPDNTESEVSHLRQFCAEVHTLEMRRSRLADARFLAESLLRGRSFILSRDTAAGMHEMIGALVERAQRAGQPYDAVHCDQLWMAQYALRVPNVRRVIDQHNAVYLIPKRMAQHERNPVKRALLEREWRVLARSEAKVCRQFDRVITVTAEDRSALERLIGGECGPISVIPICVDTTATPLVRCDRRSTTLLLLGTMYWPPNVEGALWFAREVFPLVKQGAAAARLAIVGKRPPRSVARLRSDPAIEVAGYVADPLPYVRESCAFIVPVRAGGGMRVKILDAWMWGIPVVSTPIGAEGICVRSGENILIADGAGSLADAIMRLLTDRELWARLSANGRAWVEERYDWRRGYQELDCLYSEL